MRVINQMESLQGLGTNARSCAVGCIKEIFITLAAPNPIIKATVRHSAAKNEDISPSNKDAVERLKFLAQRFERMKMLAKVNNSYSKTQINQV